jgi:hypothetical protein
VSLSPTSGTGNGSVTVSVSANTSSTRSGSVTIAGKTYTISQTGGGSGDAYEPDDSSGTAKTINVNAPQTHSIIPAIDQDWVKFTLASTSNITLETSGASGDTRLWLYNSGLGQIAYNDDGGAGLFSLITQTNLDPGTYYVKIDEYGNNNEISSYTISLSATSKVNLSPVILLLLDD